MKKMCRLTLLLVFCIAITFSIDHINAASGCYVDNSSIKKEKNTVSYKVKCEENNYIKIVEIKDSGSIYYNQVKYKEEDKKSSYEQTYHVDANRLDAIIYIRVVYFNSKGKKVKAEPKEIDFSLDETSNVVDDETFSTDACIRNFGEIKFVEAGDNNDAGGKVVFSEKDNNKTWSTKTVDFKADVQATTNHKVKDIHYKINSKEGETCTGIIKGSKVENNDGNVTVQFKINKGWVNTISVWGRSVDRNDPTKMDITKSNKINVKREMSEAEEEAIESEFEIGTGEKLQCKTIDDLLGKYWSWVMILMPVATMILIIIDFINPIISSDSDALKKASSKALKRTIALVILLMLPLITSVLFGWFGIETCF